MSLAAIDLPVSMQTLPAEATSLIQAGRERADAFYTRVTEEPPGGFLAGDYELVYSALVRLRDSDLLSGRRFCEWGSGLGVILGLARQIGYESFGIELQSELANESREWLGELGLEASIATGTCVPENLRARFGAGGEHDNGSGLANEGLDGYRELGIEPSSIDLFYVFPPPADEYVVLDLFDSLAKSGAILMSYRGEDEVLLHFKE